MKYLHRTNVEVKKICTYHVLLEIHFFIANASISKEQYKFTKH